LYNILLLEAEYRKVLSLIRHAGKKGYNVYTASLNKFSIGGSSKFVKKNYYLKELELSQILKIIKENNIDVIIPCNEKSVEFLAKNTEKFDIPLVTPNLESYIICNDKLETMKFAQKLNIRVPKTVFFNNIDELKTNIKEIGFFPVVLKPRKSSGSRGIKYIENSEELRKELNDQYINLYGIPLIQEYIPNGGKAIGASFLYYNGKEILNFCHERIRQYPPDGGPSTLAVSIYNENAVNIGRKLLENLKWNGLAMVEFKEDPKNGELVLMEINPRMWGTIGLALFSGADFLEAILKVFVEGCNLNEIDKNYNEGYYFRWFFPGDLLSIIKSKDLSIVEKAKLLFLKKEEKVIDQIIDKGDLKPMFMTFLYSLNSLFKRK
jgi:predicted ATP-grasp superfamily ATP-dependent carboligase